MYQLPSYRYNNKTSFIFSTIHILIVNCSGSYRQAVAHNKIYVMYICFIFTPRFSNYEYVDRLVDRYCGITDLVFFIHLKFFMNNINFLSNKNMFSIFKFFVLIHQLRQW